MARKTLEEKHLGRVRRFHPRFRWVTCVACGDDVRGERVWGFWSGTPLLPGNSHVCMDCAPTRPEAASIAKTEQNRVYRFVTGGHLDA